MIKTETYTNENDILIAPEMAVAISVIVSDSGITADTEGKKIIKAGTPLYATADVLMNRDTVMTTSGTTMYGIARWDIDVTDGNTNATMLIFGFVDYLKLDSTVQTVIDTAKTTLNGKITFIKGRKVL